MIAYKLQKDSLMITKKNISVLILFGILLTVIIINYPINPIAIDLNYVSIRWYGLLFFTTFLIARYKLSKDITRIDPKLKSDAADYLLLFAMVGMIIGARLLYVIIYSHETLQEYLTNPLEIIAIWKGGLSFHGGLIGLVVGVIFFIKKYKIKFLRCMDVIALTAPIGLAEGRLGNFINGELWGKITDGPFGVVFKNAGSLQRHPSQLYECVLEGVILFFILKAYSMKDRPDGAICGLFMVLYAVFRFSIEFVREPDSNLGYIAFGWLTMGQLLCMPMLFIGLITMNYESIKEHCYQYKIQKGA